MYTAVIIILILAAILLVLVVLSQSSKSSGAGPMMGSGASQLMGAARTTDLLEKITWGLIATIMILSFGANLFVEKNTTGSGNILENSTGVQKAIEQGMFQEEIGIEDGENLEGDINTDEIPTEEIPTEEIPVEENPFEE